MKLKDKSKRNNLKAEMSHVQNNHDSLSFVLLKIKSIINILYVLKNFLIVKWFRNLFLNIFLIYLNFIDLKKNKDITEIDDINMCVY